MSRLIRATLDEQFPRYTDYDPDVPVWCVTPDETGFIHRFFETSPIGPDRRTMALTRFPVEHRVPEPGEKAEIVTVDLRTGDRETVARTAGWDTQVGAHVQWGPDGDLFFNDLDTDQWEPYGVRLDVETGERTALGGPVYDVSPDGQFAAGPNLLGTRVTQHGYGAVVPEDVLPAHDDAPADDGVWLTDTETGESELLVSIETIVDELDLASSVYGPGAYYVFHVMWSPDGERLLLNFRFWPDEGDYWRWVPRLVTMRRDGSDIQLALPADVWNRGGHHIRWTHDGERITMNLRLEDDGPLRFVSMRPDGSDFTVLSESLVGSGHPSVHPDGRALITDSYLHEEVAFGDGTVPLRLVDLATETERTLVRVPSEPDFTGPNNMLRVDPHPAWGPDHRFVAFNACPEGRRQVFLADLGDVVPVE
jgi:hypothetical protein